MSVDRSNGAGRSRRGSMILVSVGAVAVSLFSGTAALAEPAPPTVAVDAAAGDSIAVARSRALGTEVTVSGTATTPSGVFESSFYDKGFGLQSGNSGIYVSDVNNSGVTVGDRVRVTGVLADQEGLLVIRPSAVKVIGKAAPIRPDKRQPGAVNEGSEGRLVSVSGIVSGPVVNDLPYGYKVPIAGRGNTVVFVNTQTGIDVGSIVVGAPITVVGFSGQYADTYEVLPRSQADVRQGFSAFGNDN